MMNASLAYRQKLEQCLREGMSVVEAQQRADGAAKWALALQRKYERLHHADIHR